MFRRAFLGLCLLAFTVTSGCVVEIGVDPRGTDASVQGSWLINGAAPTAESCAAIGVQFVRVRFFDGGTTIDHADLVFDCALGAFDTRPNRVLANGAWDLSLLAINPDGLVVAEGPREQHDTFLEGGHVIIQNVDFIASPSTLLQGSWTIDDATPTAASCTALGIAEVHVQTLDTAGMPIASSTRAFDCADGSFSSPISPGAYTMRIVAVDSAAAVVAMAANEMFSIAEGGTHVLNAGNPINFVGAGFDPRGTDSILTAVWTVGGLDADTKVCDALAATHVDLIFAAEDDTTFAEAIIVEMGAPCSDAAFDSVTPILAAGTYLVAAELRADGGAVISRIEAPTAITVAAGTPVDLDIDFRLDSSTIFAYFEYEQVTDTGIYEDCATSGATDLNWALYAGTGPTAVFVAGQEMVSDRTACVDTINVMSGVGGAALAAGNYEIDITGYISGVKTWSIGACALSIDADGGLGLTTCSVDYDPT